MSARTPNLREAMNNGIVQQLADLDREQSMGDLMGMLVQYLSANAPTEAAAAVALDAMTLANPASEVYDVVATAGTVTGRKLLLIGGAEIIPTSGQVVWDSSSGLRFAAADAVTAADVLYARKDAVNCITSNNQRTLGERD